MSTDTTIYASKGTWLDGENTSTNYGTATTFKVGQQTSGLSAGERASIVLSFDVSAYTKPSDVVKAVLDMTAVSQTGNTVRTISVYRLDQDFTEAQATWQKSATSPDTDWSGGTTVGAANNSAITQYNQNARRKLFTTFDVGFRVTSAQDADITELVKDAVNRRSGTLLLWIGIPLSDTDTTSRGNATIHSNNAVTESNRPKINITVAERIVWDGAAGDGSPATATNWVGDAAPDVYDFVMFNDGAVDIGKDGVAITFNSCFISEGYEGIIEEPDGDGVIVTTSGTVGHPVQNKVVINKKVGKFNIKLGLASIEFDTFISNTPNETPSYIVAHGGDSQNVFVSNTGKELVLLSTYNFKSIVLSHDTTGSRQVKIQTSVGSPLKSAKSKVLIESALGEFVLSNGTKATATTASTAIATSGTSWIVGKSVLTHKGRTISEEINIARGRLTFNNNENGNITTSAIVLWDGGVFDPRTDVGAWNSDVSPEINVKGGGDFIVDVGRTLTITN